MNRQPNVPSFSAVMGVMGPISTDQIHTSSSNHNVKTRISRREFFRRGTLVAGGAVVCAAGYASLIEPSEIDVTQLDMPIQRLAPAFDGFRIAVIADLHYGPFTGAKKIEAAVNSINHLRPDVVTIVGDFVTEPAFGNRRKGALEAEPCARILAGLRAPHGAFAVLGNHDANTDPQFVFEALTRHGIKVLRNKNQALEQDGARLWLAGVNDVLVGKPDLDVALSNIPADEARVLLAHEPDFADRASRYDVDFQLSGHSHGGQVRFPGVPPLYLPPLGHKYYEGSYQIGKMRLYTNRGIGMVTLPFRFDCPPEITVVTLRKA